MRRAKPEKREILPDIRYHSITIQTMIHHMLHRGKKSTATSVMYATLDILRERSGGKDPVEIFDSAMRNVSPAMEVRPRRVGGATFQVPMEIRSDRKVSISMKNLISFARKRTGHSMAERLAAEVMAAYNQEGGAFKRKEDTHRMAEANKAFAHFRF